MEQTKGKVYGLFVEFIQKIESPIKTKTAGSGNFSYLYADLADVIRSVNKALPKGLGWTQRSTSEGSNVTIETIFFADDGSQISSGQLFLPVSMGGKMNNVQAIGSTITYGRRYQLSAMAGIASDEDTDAQEIVIEQSTDNKKASQKQLSKIRVLFKELAKFKNKTFSEELQDHNLSNIDVDNFSKDKASKAIKKLELELSHFKASD